MDMNNMNIEQFDALLVNQAAMDYDLMQFLRSFDDDEEQPQEQLFTLPTDEFDPLALRRCRDSYHYTKMQGLLPLHYWGRPPLEL
jgi:hypothetical protein